MVLFLLPHQPQDASWLTASERHWIIAKRKLRDETTYLSQPILPLLRKQLVLMKNIGLEWGLIAAFLINVTGFVTWAAFFPLLFRSASGWGVDVITLVMIAPAVCDIVGRILLGFLSSRFQEYFYHEVVAVTLAGLACFVCYLFSTMGYFTLVFISFAASQFMVGGMLPLWFALLTRSLDPESLPLGLTALNISASLGAIIGPILFPLLTGGTLTLFGAAIFCCFCFGAFVVFALIARWMPTWFGHKRHSGNFTVLKEDAVVDGDFRLQEQ